jgi:DNA-binding response OmpR family regulator/signal transduction histidine kinase
LFVDDEADVLELLQKTFERRYEVLTAQGGEAALAILASRRVDLLVTDQKMPEMTGIELVAAARAVGHDVTAILLTGYTDPTDLIAAINKGQVYRYVTKPWDVNDLLITVKNAVEYTQLRRDKDRLIRQLAQRVDALSVMYEVTQTSGDAQSYDAIIDRVLTAVARVLPYDVGAALVAAEEGKSATLRLRCTGAVGEKALVGIQDAVLAAYRKQSGLLLKEDRVITRVTGAAKDDAPAAGWGSELCVPLKLAGETVGTIALFSTRAQVYGADDGPLLDALANQTAAAIQAVRAAEQEARLRIERMVTSMSDGVLLTDEKNEIVVMNPAARALLRLGEDPRESTAKHLQESLGFYPFELVRGWEYGGAQVVSEELQLFDKTVQSVITPVADARGVLHGVCVVLRDITEQKQLEERKDEFVSIISHELRTPLTSITGALDLVLNRLAGSVNEKQHRYLSMAKDSTEKLNTIVDDLLDLSKFAKGRLRMSFELTYLDELVNKALEKYGPALTEKRITVDLELPEKPIRALVDPNRLHQVLNNLLTNSVKFTPEDGKVRLQLKVAPGMPGFVSLSCWNSGEPISDADLERIFDKFEQARSARTRTVRGTGLGLAICRNIVEAHGGHIWAEPCGEGARFVVVLPFEPAPALLLPDETPKQVPTYSGPPRKILLVEDEPELAYILKSLLLSRPYQVLLAQNADEALSVARRQRPDLILLDVHLPDVDGLRLMEILQHDPVTRNAAMVAISGSDERTRALRGGANAFLQKPLQTDSFLATVDGLARGPDGRQKGSVLVVDDDEKIAAICGEVLANLGFEVRIAGTLEQARQRIGEKRPDLLLLDVQLPDGDGLSFLEALKAERASSQLGVIFISAKTDTAAKVRALKLGGDDYLTKPFDALELGARVESVLRRRNQEMGTSPTTQLPGSGAIEREVQRRLRERSAFAFCYLDLDNLKAYNDFYGFAKADGVVRQTGDLLREVVAQHGLTTDFIGHVAGDDFVFIADVTSVDALCQRIIEAFDRLIPLYYDKGDRQRGYIEAEDRYGQRRRFPLMSVSIAAVMCDGRTMDHAELANQAAELKKRAKAVPGSVYLRSDRELTTRSIA